MSKVIATPYSENRWNSTDKIFAVSVGLFVVSAVALVIIFSIANHLGLNKEIVLYTTCALCGFAIIAMITSVALKLCHQASSTEQSSSYTSTQPLNHSHQRGGGSAAAMASVTNPIEMKQLESAIQKEIKAVTFTQEILNQFRKNGSEFDENNRVSLEKVLENEIFMQSGPFSHFSVFCRKPAYAQQLASEASPPLAQLVGSLLLRALSNVRVVA